MPDQRSPLSWLTKTMIYPDHVLHSEIQVPLFIFAISNGCIELPVSAEIFDRPSFPQNQPKNQSVNHKAALGATNNYVFFVNKMYTEMSVYPLARSAVCSLQLYHTRC